MKHFIFAKESEKVSRMYGGADVKVSVYRLVRNRPVFVCFASWCTRGCMGAQSEVMHALARHGDLPKRYADGYYKSHHGGPVTGQPFTITAVGGI